MYNPGVKTVALLLTASIVSSEIAETMDESLFLPPHVEHEANTPKLTEEVRCMTSGGASDSEPLGRFRHRVFHTKMLLARQNYVARLNAFADTARTIMQKYPVLKPWQRKQQYDMLKYEIILIKLRTRGVQDFSGALPAVAQALGVFD